MFHPEEVVSINTKISELKSLTMEPGFSLSVLSFRLILLVGPVELLVKIIIEVSSFDDRCAQHTMAVNILVE